MDPNLLTRPTIAQPQRSAKPNYKEAVLATLAYFDLFEYPLTLDEITRYLYQLPPDSHLIEVMVKESRKIKQRGSYYQLAESPDRIQTRHERELIAKRFWKRVEKYRWVFQLIPYVRLAAVCNTLALNNTKEESDIDLFIVTQPNRLFTARLLITALLHGLGVRRHGGKIAGRFCLSFFVAEGHLKADEIAKKPYDIYLAYWLQTVQPVAGERRVYEALLEQNASWLGQFFKTRPHYNMHHFKETSGWMRALQKTFEKILNSKWGDRFEEKLSAWQLRRAEKKRNDLNESVESSDVVVSRTLLKFHNTDRRNEIFRNWVKKLEILNKPPLNNTLHSKRVPVLAEEGNFE